ncbi:MAG: T9SS type A sorting domain-containing protein [Bacteroidetes bacterium]|nr:T9SS type A sorting domain-containing protein [Bacteroidota bacterium]
MHYCLRAEWSKDDVISNNEKCYTRTDELSILNPYPNPVSEEANIRIILPYKSKLMISVYDQAGRLMSEVFNDLAPDGFSDYKFDVSNLPEGLYTIRVIFKDKVFYRQLVVSHSK